MGQSRGSGKTQALADSQSPGFFTHRMAERNVRQGKPAMQEQVGFIVVLPARLETGDDLAEFSVQRGYGQFSRLDVSAQTAELAAAALAPVIDDELCHHISQ